MSLGSVAVGLLPLALLFWPLETLRPARIQPRWRRDTPAYWFFTPLVTRAITRGSLVVAVVLLAFAAGVPLDREHVRWHHTTEAEGLDKNFAGLFPFIDLAFGTFYMPRDRQPAAFGIQGDPVPSGLLAQLAYPFRRARRGPAAA